LRSLGGAEGSNTTVAAARGAASSHFLLPPGGPVEFAEADGRVARLTVGSGP
jgi:hypothetical protein